jgi:hypothetical protein
LNTEWIFVVTNGGEVLISAMIDGLIEDDGARGRNESTSVSVPQAFPAESKVKDPLSRAVTARTAAPLVLQASTTLSKLRIELRRHSLLPAPSIFTALPWKLCPSYRTQPSVTFTN